MSPVAQKTYKRRSRSAHHAGDPSTLPSLPADQAERAIRLATSRRPPELVTNVDVAARVKSQLHLSDSPQDLLEARSPRSRSRRATSWRYTAKQTARPQAHATGQRIRRPRRSRSRRTSSIRKSPASSRGSRPQLTAARSHHRPGTLAELQALSTGPDPEHAGRDSGGPARRRRRRPEPVLTHRRRHRRRAGAWDRGRVRRPDPRPAPAARGSAPPPLPPSDPRPNPQGGQA